MIDRNETVTAGEAARLTGTSIRALRHYEAKGLVNAVRGENGYRHFDGDALMRVMGVRILQSIGLSLDQIRVLYRERDADLGAMLDAQAEALAADARRIAATRAYVDRARALLARDETLRLSDIVNLLENSTMNKPPKAFEGMETPKLTPEQEANLISRNFTEKDQEEVTARWAKVFAEAEALVGTDPASERAQSMAREAKALINWFSGGDPGLENHAGSMWEKAWTDPERAKHMPVSREGWDFLQNAMAGVMR